MRRKIFVLSICLLLAAAKVSATALCFSLSPNWSPTYYMDNISNKQNMGYPIKGGKTGVEAQLAWWNANKMVNVSDIKYDFMPDGKFPVWTCGTNIGTYLDQADIYIYDAPCRGGGGPPQYFAVIKELVPTGWVTTNHPGFMPATELGIRTRYDVHTAAPATPQYAVAGPVVKSGLSNRKEVFGYCTANPTAIGFFNGVSNTELEAKNNLTLIRREYGETRKMVPLEYELFYNQSGCIPASFGYSGCIADVVEVFLQRQKELDDEFQERWEYFWDLVADRESSEESWIGQIRNLIEKNGSSLFSKYRAIADSIRTKFVEISSHLITYPPNEYSARKHIDQINKLTNRQINAVFIAHSQGNLFANIAFDAYEKRPIKKNGDTILEARVVHVAPASTTLRGEYLLTDSDLVINGLRQMGQPAFNPNVSIPRSSKDPSGHSFGPTYFNPSNAAGAKVKSLIETALDSI